MAWPVRGKSRWIWITLCVGIPLCFLGCSAQNASPAPSLVPSPNARATADPSQIPSPSPTATFQAGFEAMATLRTQSTLQPCRPEQIVAYANEVIPLANQHLAAADFARSLQPWQEGQPEFRQGYIQASERLNQLERVLAPACADKTQLKMTNSFKLLLDVWDHLGEGEFNIAQRKLASSFDELSRATTLLTGLQSGSELKY